MYFTVKFDVTFRLKNDRIPEFLTSEITVKSAIEDVIVQEAQDISEAFEIENDRGYQAQLKEVLDPRFGGSQLVQQFDLVRVGIRAHVPEDVRAETEMLQKIKNLDQRIVTAEADGNKEEANRLRDARNAWAEASQVRAQHSIGNATLALEMQKVKNQLIDLDIRVYVWPAGCPTTGSCTSHGVPSQASL